MIYLLMSRHEVHGFEKLVSFGLKPMLYHIFKGISTKRDDENNHVCVSVCATQCLTSNLNIVEVVEFYGRLCSLFC